MGKSSINGRFSMAMLNNQRVPPYCKLQRQKLGQTVKPSASRYSHSQTALFWLLRKAWTMIKNIHPQNLGHGDLIICNKSGPGAP